MLRALVDASPLIAIAATGEPDHEACLKALRTIPSPLLTVWPVIAESLHILRGSPAGQDTILSMLEAGSLELAALTREDVPRIRSLMEKYADQPMDLADAALVRVAEREQITRILTLDRKDFSVYRAGRWGPFQILP